MTVIPCPRCGQKLCSRDNQICFACLLDSACETVPRWALQLRTDSRLRIHVRALIVFEQFADLNTILPFNRRDSIIMVCEQLKQLRKHPDVKPHEGSFGEDKTPRTSEGRSKHAAVDLLAKLRAACALDTNGKCVYCGQVLEDEQWSLDSLVPTHIHHNSGDKNEQLVYWKAMILAQLAVPCCYTCNGLKGYAEKRGLNILRSIYAGTSVFTPASPLLPSFRRYTSDSFDLMQWLGHSATREALRSRKPYTDFDVAHLSRALLRLAFRVSLSEPLQDETKYSAFMSYAARQIIFANVPVDTEMTYIGSVAFRLWKKGDPKIRKPYKIKLAPDEGTAQ